MKERWPVRPEARAKAALDIENIINDPFIEFKLRVQAIKTLIEMDKLNLKENEIEQRNNPKHIVHTNMTMDELTNSIQQKLKELNISEADVPKLLEYAQRT